MKRILSILSVFLLIAAMITIVSATEVSFTKRYVDSNEWTFVTTAKKQTTTTTASIYVTAIYKKDGSDSDYWRLYARASSTGSSKLITSGSWCDLTIPTAYRDAGKFVPLELMGHDPSLDCQVSGYWVVH